MKILLIADIHGNLPAMQAVIAETRAVDKILCLGDIAGYFPFLNEVIETLSSMNNIICIKGNHDHVLLNENLSTGSFSADIAISMQKADITDINKRFLTNLPETVETIIDGRKFLLLHGSLKDPLNGRDSFWENEVLREGIYLFGHSHKPFFCESHVQEWMVINPGSCGLPRDGDSRASFAIFDTVKWKVSFHKVVYSINEVAKRCREVGLPENFWKSLESGEWVMATNKGGDS